MLNRRSVLAGLGGVALAGTLRPARALVGSPAGLDLGNRRDLLTSLAKMRGATDERLCIGYVVGARYAVPEHRVIPMMGILAGTFSQYRRISDDAFESRALEIAYFTDLETGKLLEKWKNPVTGTTVDVPLTRMGPSRVILTADGLTVPKLSGEAAGLQLKHIFQPPVIVGDDVWITEQINIDGPSSTTNSAPITPASPIWRIPGVPPCPLRCSTRASLRTAPGWASGTRQGTRWPGGPVCARLLSRTCRPTM